MFQFKGHVIYALQFPINWFYNRLFISTNMNAINEKEVSLKCLSVWMPRNASGCQPYSADTSDRLHLQAASDCCTQPPGEQDSHGPATRIAGSAETGKFCQFVARSALIDLPIYTFIYQIQRDFWVYLNPFIFYANKSEFCYRLKRKTR